MPVTAGLGAAMVAVHVAAGLWDWRHGNVDGWGVVYGDRTKDAMIAFGGRSTALVAAGQVWRLVSCGFLHAGPIHLALNGLALAGLGPLVEVVFGRARALGMFLAAVIAGALLSQLGGAPLAVGASGGVFGWMGALVAFGARKGPRLHARLRPMFGRGLWPWVAVNLAVGLLVPGVDNLGHVGGLVAGLGAGALSGDLLVDNASGDPRITVIVGVASAGLLLFAATGLALAFPGAVTSPG